MKENTYPKQDTPLEVSDGNIQARVRVGGTVEIKWNNTPYNHNNLTIMNWNDARSIYALLGSLLGGQVSATKELSQKEQDNQRIGLIVG